jgi:SAM-dependent methyltransferase
LLPEKSSIPNYSSVKIGLIKIKMFAKFKKFLSLDHVKKHADLDAPETTILHGEIIQSKIFLKKIYEENYTFFIAASRNLPKGIAVEIGSGAGFIKKFLPDVITSDILELSSVDKVFSALDFPFEKEALKAIYMIDVLHHLPDAYLFFSEAERVLKPGGKIIMVEPANTLWGRFIYKNFHHEPFEPNIQEWKLPAGGPMSVANGALPWVILVRDKERFILDFPQLEIKSISYCHPFRYLLSGGVSMKQLLPDFMYPVVKFSEDVLLRFLAPYMGMFMRIVIQKK